MDIECPECGSTDIDLNVSGPEMFECQECGCKIDNPF